MDTRPRQVLLIGIGIALAPVAMAVPAATSLAHPDRDESWVATWATAPVAVAPSPDINLNNQTLRQIVHISIGGEMVRVRFSNAFGTLPLVVGAAHLAVRGTGNEIVPGSGGPLTFGGSPSITIPAGAVVLSDPVDLDAEPLSDVAIDLYLPGDTGASASPLTRHSGALQTNYVSSAGNFAGSTSLGTADRALDGHGPTFGRRDAAERRLSARADVVGAVDGAVADVAHDSATLSLAIRLRQCLALARHWLAGRRTLRRRLR